MQGNRSFTLKMNSKWFDRTITDTELTTPQNLYKFPSVKISYSSGWHFLQSAKMAVLDLKPRITETSGEQSAVIYEKSVPRKPRFRHFLALRWEKPKNLTKKKMAGIRKRFVGYTQKVQCFYFMNSVLYSAIKTSLLSLRLIFGAFCSNKSSLIRFECAYVNFIIVKLTMAVQYDKETKTP